jgi:hypothetical protein
VDPIQEIPPQADLALGVPWAGTLLLGDCATTDREEQGAQKGLGEVSAIQAITQCMYGRLSTCWAS